ncbi:hypothetical protein Acr_00g0024570 [Actinidia rufa]|uniref:RNase H type-1 domain-containing protein n=1 Tax=Actinidia rufa TaxID=165716 RepID=A0A7J0DDR6_9ERIC|nr:hypothetical protein Acr_00g0024570 [Actinidia rufa]
MLNPSKCIFGVSSGKFLQFLVTKRGIEVNSDQIQALIAMSSPRNIRDVQQLTRRVATLSRFVSKSTDKYLPFFRIMRKNQTFQWNEESETIFQQLKEYLDLPSLLTVPNTGEELFVYLSISPTAEQSSDEDLVRWMLFVDGSSNQHSCEAGLVFQTLSGDQMEYAIRIGFKATNNEAEYKALLADLRVATEIGVDSLDVFSDLQLVVNQVQGDYPAKDTRMVAYLDEIDTSGVPSQPKYWGRQSSLLGG